MTPNRCWHAAAREQVPDAGGHTPRCGQQQPTSPAVNAAPRCLTASSTFGPTEQPNPAWLCNPATLPPSRSACKGIRRLHATFHACLSRTHCIPVAKKIDAASPCSCLLADSAAPAEPRHGLRTYWANLGKREIKTPKLYFYNTGLVCALLRIRSPDQVKSHPLRGPVFETWVIGEVLKGMWGARSELRFYRGRKGLEVALLIDQGDRVSAVEIKSSRTLAGDFFEPLAKFGAWFE